MEESERIVPPTTLVERRVDQEAGVGVERPHPTTREHVELVGERIVADVPSDPRRAVIAERDVERVCDRMREPALEELLAVVAAQVVVHVHERPVPVDAGQAEFADVGQEGVGECAALAGEPVGAARHPVTDRQVALLLAHGDQRRCEFDGP